MCAQCWQASGTLATSGATLGAVFAGRVLWLGARRAVGRHRDDDAAVAGQPSASGGASVADSGPRPAAD